MTGEQRKTVLLVDDEPGILILHARVLRSVCDVVEARDARIALKQLDIRRFDAVITDLNLHDELDGIGLLDAAAKRQPKARRVLVSGSRPADIASLVDTGRIHQYLQKPVPQVQLQATVR